MAAGVVPVVSDCTGAMEVVKQIDPRLITTLQPEDIAEKVIWFLGLPFEIRNEMSLLGKKLIEDKYTEDKAVNYFQRTFNDAIAAIDKTND